MTFTFEITNILDSQLGFSLKGAGPQWGSKFFKPGEKRILKARNGQLVEWIDYIDQAAKGKKISVVLKTKLNADKLDYLEELDSLAIQACLDLLPVDLIQTIRGDTSFSEENKKSTVHERSREVLDNLYELSGANTMVDQDFNELVTRLSYAPEEFSGVINYLEEKNFVRTANHSAAGMPGSIYLTAVGIDAVEAGSTKWDGLKHQPSIDIFVSHSSKDLAVVKALVDVLRSALHLESTRIRCSSLEGFRLPGGVNTDEQLRQEVHECKVLIGVLTLNSIKSAYVLFELGARWGAKLKMIPLLACGTSIGVLKGPLVSINALDLTNAAQVHQLIDEISETLGKSIEPVSSYVSLIDRLVKENDLSRGNSHPEENHILISESSPSLPTIESNSDSPEVDSWRSHIESRLGWSFDKINSFLENGESIIEILDKAIVELNKKEKKIGGMITMRQEQLKSGLTDPQRKVINEAIVSFRQKKRSMLEGIYVLERERDMLDIHS